jgi:hypothetical protein
MILNFFFYGAPCMKITTIIHGVMQIIHQTLKAKNHCQGTYLSKDIIWVSYGR